MINASCNDWLLPVMYRIL